MTEAYLEPDQVELLEAQADNLRDKLIIRLLRRLACRESELIGLREEDIDFQARGVRIERLKQRLKLHCPKCDASLSRKSHFCGGCGEKVEAAVQRASEKRRLRFLPVDPDTLGLLREYLERATRRTDTRVFPITRWTVIGVVKKCAARAGLQPLFNPVTGRQRGVSPHRLRDAFAVHALQTDDSGESQRMLQEWLGHERYDTTAGYRKVSGQDLNDWLARVQGNGKKKR